ncbi:glycosyltransferase family 8 protein [Hymenobacter sediminis]|uniref:glycosyltransferase family 8 protein n=1 Tax=Hymenobacter sediminis TaxID=2218621 RepID=UPI000DA67FC9|nr:glycosyltransferase family 8 protein [Hymenobacter sediminis]RPD46896.1 glycosyltransferase family 8 protein [Hymenobacter sediminis]
MSASRVFHLGITFDQNYLDQFYALSTSIFVSNPSMPIAIHAIATGIQTADKAKIEEHVQAHNSTITFYQIDQSLISQFVLGSKWTAAVYYRLFFAFLVPESVEYLLYIDSDTLVVGDLDQFNQIDLGTCPVAAVYDNWVKTQPLLGITEEGQYFNSGVLFMQMKEWRRQQISEQALQYLQQYPERIKYVDQCALNAVLRNNWKKIDSRFNTLHSYVPEMLPRKEFETYLTDKVILHFTLHRPWAMLCQNRFRYLYHRYLQQSPSTQKELYTDFALSKVPALLRIRLRELYIDNPALGRQWRQLKAKLR